MIPYYEDDHATIYHGDCREILPQLELPVGDVVIVTDPPYGIGLDPDYSGLQGTKAFNVGRPFHSGRAYERIHGDDEPFDPTWLDGVDRVLFGVDHYLDRLPPGGTLHTWDKRDGLGSNMFGDVEYVWSSFASGPSRLYRFKWLGFMRAGEHEYLHPTQKPVSLMRWILGWTPRASTIDAARDRMIVDPYVGSGSTLRAAKDCGRRSVGIELVEAYCEIAARRLAQEVLPFEIPGAVEEAEVRSLWGEVV